MYKIQHLLKYKKVLWGLVAVSILIFLYIAWENHNIKHIKYRELEQKLVEIHTEMRRDIPKESWDKMEHFGVGLSVRNYYNLWDDRSELRLLFEKNGVFHPDDMSRLIMETFVRAQRGVPFSLHKLIKLQSEFYDTKNKRDHMLKMVEEFLTYQ